MKSPYIHFTVGDTGLSHSVFRCIVADSHSSEAGECDLRTALRCLKNPQVWIILIRSGGHFAGAVFKGYVLLKTFLPHMHVPGPQHMYPEFSTCMYFNPYMHIT